MSSTHAILITAVLAALSGCSTATLDQSADVAPYLGRVFPTTHKWVVCRPVPGERSVAELLIVSENNARVICQIWERELPIGTPIRVVTVKEKLGIDSAGLVYVFGDIETPGLPVLRAAIGRVKWTMPPW